MTPIEPHQITDRVFLRSFVVPNALLIATQRMPPTRRSQTLSAHRLGLLGPTQRASSSKSRSTSLCDSLTSRDADGSLASDLTDPSDCYVLLQESISVASKTKQKVSGPPERCPLAFVKINGVVLKPTKVFDAFWYWVAERKAMDDKRRAGEASPCVWIKYLVFGLSGSA